MGTTALEFIIAAKDEASAVFDKVGDAAKRQQTTFSKFQTGAGVALAAVGAAATKFAADSVAAYAEAEQSQALLVQAFEKFPALADTNIESLRELNTELQRKTGFDDDATAAAQATLAQYNLTGEQIAALTPLMQDYAAKTGTDLVTAAEQLGKATFGQGRALKDVGIDFQDTGSVAGNLEQIMAGLESQVGGTAETMGSTATGKAQILKATFGDLQESVGELLLPVLSKLVDITITTIDAFNKTGNAGKIVVGVVGGLVVVLGAIVAATKIATAVQAAYNFVMMMNPIGLVVLAIVALIAIFVVAYNKVDWFRNGVNAIWDGIVSYFKTAVEVWKTVLGAVWDFIQDVWSRSPLKFVIDNWDAIIGAFSAGVEKVKAFISGAWDFIKKVWSYSPLGLIVTNWDAIVNFFKTAPDKIKDALSRVRDVMFAPFKAAFNWIADGWNNSVGKLSFTVPDIPGVPGRGTKFSFPKIPALATGGEVLSGGFAVVGERGPELVKLPGGSTVFSNAESRRAGGSSDEVAYLLRRLIDVVREGSTLYADGAAIAQSSTSGDRFLAAMGAR